MLLAIKHLSGGEFGLLMLLENLFAPLWVYLRFGDVPSAWTVAGGTLLLATIVGHECAGRRDGGARDDGGARPPDEEDERPYVAVEGGT